MDSGLRVELGGYLFDLEPLRGVARRYPGGVLLEAPQGLVQFLPELARVVERLFGVEARFRLEPSYGLCSLGLREAEELDAALVHVGHDFYPYPLCPGRRCLYRLPGRVVLVPGEYLGGDPEALAEAASAELPRGARVVLARPSQHRGLAERLREALRRRGLRVEAVEPIVGCYFANLLRHRGRVDAYLVAAGGWFHALGLGLALAGEGPRVLRLDPYTGSVEDAAPLVSRTLAKRFWAMQRFTEARRVAVIAGLLPGQHRPGMVEALVRLLRRSGREAEVVYAERLSRELLDNLNPRSYDAYIVTSCPRLAVEDLGDYWKPVLTPGEALVVLLEGRPSRYLFPW